MENNFEKKIEDKEREREKKKSHKNTKLRSLTAIFSLIGILCCENQDESPLEQELI